MLDEREKLLEKEEHLRQELSHVNVQLIALGQSLMSLGYHLKENPTRILITGCEIDINNPNPNCADFPLDFKELQECPELILKLLRSYFKLQEELESIRSRLEEEEDKDDDDEDEDEEEER